MSGMNELERFEADLEKDEGLRKSMDDALRRIAEAGAVASDGEAMAAAAAELGYEISVADLERASAEAQDLDDDELESVAGGMSDSIEGHRLEGEDEYGHDKGCVATWHCFAALMHTETKDRNHACWSNYLCVFINENPAVKF